MSRYCERGGCTSPAQLLGRYTVANGETRQTAACGKQHAQDLARTLKPAGDLVYWHSAELEGPISKAAAKLADDLEVP